MKLRPNTVPADERPPTKKPVAQAIIDVVEDLAVFVGSLFGTHAASYFDIETSESKNVLVTRNGSLVSGIVIQGISMLVGPEEFEQVCESLNRSIASIMARRGHVMQIWFERDTDGVRNLIEEAIRPSRVTAKRLGLNFDDLLDSKVEHLPKYCTAEKIFLGLWTTAESLPRQTQANIQKERRNDFMKTPGVVRPGMQNLVAAVPDLRDTHESTVTMLLETLRESGFSCGLLSAHEMVREMRLAISPSVTTPDWNPCLPGDPVARVPRGVREGDLADIGYPNLSWQVFPQDMERSKNMKYLTIGDRSYAPLSVEFPPREIMPFSRLFSLVAAAKIPWRMSFLIEGGGVSTLSFKAAMASFLTWAGVYNRQIDEAVTHLRQLEFEGIPNIKLRMSLCTWAPNDDFNLLSDRVARLSKCLSNWGNAEVREVSGDPMLGFVSSCPFMTLKSAANPSIAPVEHFVRMLPIDRLASYWQTGGVIFRTNDGRVIPFEPGSSLQTASNYLFFARPGMGKSVLMAAINLASVIRAGIEKLPYISYIDIGPSSKGFVDLVRDSLPEDKRHYAAHFKLRMSKEYAVNVFDTQPLLRYPLPDEKSFLIDFLTLVATPAERTTPYESISALASKVIDEAYRTFSDTTKSKPKVYMRGIEPMVDMMLDNHRFYPEKGEPWWAIVDFLFSKGELHLASIAQRYAVPTLEDIASIASSADFNRTITIQETGESLNIAFSRLLADAIRDFPVIGSVTRFDIGETRILAIDLDEVAKDGGASSRRQSAIMYMLARFVAAKNFRLHKDVLNDIPNAYQDFYRKRIAEIHSTMKWIIYDEFHRTSFSSSVRQQVIIDMREGRKWNLGVMLASQSVEDFDATMKEFASGVFILNAGTHTGADNLQKLFGFNDSAKKMLLNYANGPKSTGAPFLVQFSTKIGASTQFLVSSISPVEVWAFSTTAEDVVLRDIMTAALGAPRARKLLARHFPGGSAKEEIERIRKSMNGIDVGDNEEQEKGVIQALADRLLAGETFSG